MSSPLSFDEAQTIKSHIAALAANPDTIAAFHAVVDVWDANPGLYEAVHVKDPETGVTLANPGPDATRMAAKYARKTAAAAQDWLEGITNPKDSFKQAAIRAKGKWANRLQEAIAQDRFGRGMNAVDEAEAIATAVADNGAAYTAGTAKREPKVRRVFGRLAPLLGAVSQSIRSMPQDTDAQRAQRLAQARVLMIEVGRRLKGVG